MGCACPTTISEALKLLAAGRGPILAGCTDVYPARSAKPLPEDGIDITRLGDLRGITEAGDHWRIGALTTWSDLAHAKLPPCFDALRQAATQVGGIQIQNVATIGGNLCNASPAADGVPPLLGLDAEVELSAVAGTRRLPLERFVLGNRATARRPDEMLTAIVVPKWPDAAVSEFFKLGARRYLVISIAMVSVLLAREAGRITAARIAVGACSPAARRLPALEAALVGQPCGPILADLVCAEHLAPLSPIDDVRGSAAYRRDAVLTMVRRGLAAAARKLSGGA